MVIGKVTRSYCETAFVHHRLLTESSAMEQKLEYVN